MTNICHRETSADGSHEELASDASGHVSSDLAGTSCVAPTGHARTNHLLPAGENTAVLSIDKTSSETLGDWFKLKDRKRLTFELDPERGDARFWCGDSTVQEQVKSAVFDGLDQGVPRLIVYGEYGTGKTHALRHCEWMLDNDQTHGAVQVKRIEWAGFGSRTRFVDLYRDTMGRLGLPFISSLVHAHFFKNKALSLPSHLAEPLGQDTDLEIVLRQLARLDSLSNVTRLPDAKTNMAWRWLTGHVLRQSDRKALNVSASLLENATPARLVPLLQLWGYLSELHHNKKLLLLYDEAEQVSELKRNRDALNSFTSATRALFDRSQKDIGVILAFYATDLNESDLIRPDTLSRLNPAEQVIQLGALATPDKRREFLRRVLVELVEPGHGEYHPFEPAAFAHFAEHCEKLLIGLADERRKLLTRQGDPTPRTVLVALESITRVAYNLRAPTISIDFMTRHFPRLRNV